MKDDGRNDDARDASNDAQDESLEVERDTGDDETKRDALEPNANPPRTTKGWFTAPKFGSASSGGGEIEPGPEKD